MRLKDYPKYAAPAGVGGIAIGLLHLYLDAPGHQIAAFLVGGVAALISAAFAADMAQFQKDED